MKKLLLFALTISSALVSNAQLSNGGMDSWRSMPVITVPNAGLEAPDDWSGLDSVVFMSKLLFQSANPKKQLFKTTNKHSGSFAAVLVTKEQDSLGVIPGILTNTKVSLDIANYDPNNPMSAINYTGGTPLTQRVQEMSAYIKYEPRGLDKGFISVRAVIDGAGAGGADSVVGKCDSVIFQSYASYTQVIFPIVYKDPSAQPNKLVILFASSNLLGFSVPTDSSMMWIDDIALFTNGIDDVQENVASIYPNPAGDFLKVSAKEASDMTWKAYNLNGQLMIAKPFNKELNVDLSNFAAGMYTYRIQNKEGIVVQRGKFEVAK